MLGIFNSMPFNLMLFNSMVFDFIVLNLMAFIEVISRPCCQVEQQSFFIID